MESATIAIVVIGVLFILGLTCAITAKVFAANEGQEARRARTRHWYQTRGEQRRWTPPPEYPRSPAIRSQERRLEDDVELMSFRDSAATLQEPPRVASLASRSRRSGL
ncbi:hypothetical protein EDB81DRAFT_802115 [Dactylonectria macrodidyma]|uniref:Uncharacterized protein n=1 Tax=Dactylonectria macrodidyma TaxID=307937 RepID=A0A9P9IZV6_9HYPO|nr:hypothetical protein EDB81DRAFT_802115 [Dactylonectria macrodidyma]